MDVDYIVSGRLEKLEEIDYEGGVKVEVPISAQMTSMVASATVWSNSVSKVATVNQHDVPDDGARHREIIDAGARDRAMKD